MNYIKEVFLDSETAVAVVSGLPQLTADTYLITPDEMVKTRGWVNELTGSRRVVSHGTMSPELGARGLDAMRAQSEKLKIEAWKGYPGQPLGPKGQGWWSRTPPSSSRASSGSETSARTRACRSLRSPRSTATRRTS
jgi:hypothetical protein